MAVALDNGPMPSRDAFFEMGVRHVAEHLERFEISVHGRWIDLRMTLADARRDLLGGRVMARMLERLEHETTLHGHAAAGLADALRDVHSATLSRQAADCKRLLRLVAIRLVAR